jgi:hypothetical protein
LAGDWGLWLQQMHALESDLFSPLLAAVRSGQLERLTLIMSHATRMARLAFGKGTNRKFWITPSLARLAA